MLTFEGHRVLNTPSPPHPARGGGIRNGPPGGMARQPAAERAPSRGSHRRPTSVRERSSRNAGTGFRARGGARARRLVRGKRDPVHAGVHGENLQPAVAARPGAAEADQQMRHPQAGAHDKPGHRLGGRGRGPVQRGLRQPHERDDDQLLEPIAGDEIEGPILPDHPPAVDPAHDVRHDRDGGGLQRLQGGRDPLHPERDVVDAPQGVVVPDEVHERLVDAGPFQPERILAADEPGVHRDVQAGCRLDAPDRRQESLPRQAALGVAPAADQDPRVPVALERPAGLDQHLWAFGRDHGRQQAPPAVVAHQLAAIARERDRRVLPLDPVQHEHAGQEEGDAPAPAFPAGSPGLHQHVFFRHRIDLAESPSGDFAIGRIQGARISCRKRTTRRRRAETLGLFRLVRHSTPGMRPSRSG